jgi:hypothetical protein
VDAAAPELLIDENAVCRPHGALGFAEAGLDADAATACALPAGSGVALGAFCGAALPMFLSLIAQDPAARLAGPAPTPAQAAILARLGLADRHLALRTPMRFARLVSVRGQPPGSVPAAPAYVALMQRLRDPPAAALPFAAAILPRAEGGGVALRNRNSLAAWLRARRVRLLNPDEEDFAGTAAALAHATLLILADPAQASLLGLCPPGTKILEIAPEGWAPGAARGFAAALGMEWALFFGTAPSYPLTGSLPFGAVSMLGYEASIPALASVLSVI